VECHSIIRRHPDELICPASCPFLRAEPTRLCEFKCVRKDECSADDPLANFADPSTMRCATCLVSACTMCGDHANSCATCHPSYDLVDGKCISRYWWVWCVGYCFLGLLGLVVVAYVISLGFRSTVNETVLSHAVKFRSSSKTRNEVDGKFYSLAATNVRSEYISGIGVMLHFNWQGAVILWAVGTLLVLGNLAIVFKKRASVQKVAPVEGGTFDACSAHVTDQADDFNHMEVGYFYGVLFLYLASTAACLGFAVHQRRWAQKMSEQLTTMQDYMLVATGLPNQPGTEPVEEDLTKFFKAAFSGVGAEVVGVSVCWDYQDCSGAVDEQIRCELDRYEWDWETERGHEGSRTQGARVHDQRRQEAEESTDVPPRCVSIQKHFHKFDALLGVEEIHSTPGGSSKDPDEVRKMVERLQSSGIAYIVFNTEEQRDRALQQCQATPLVYPPNVPSWCQYKISLKSTDVEPEVVLWNNFRITRAQVVNPVVINIFKGILVIILTVFLLDLFFYFPYVSYILRCSEIKGMTQGNFVQSTLLGLLICLCNQLIYMVIGKISDKCGFHTTDDHQSFYVVSYTGAVFANTIIDLCTVVFLAQGYSVDEAMAMQVSSDSSMSTKAIADNPGLQMSLYIQMWAYIFPSCLLLPFVLEPIANAGLHQIDKWLVGSRHVAVQDAETRLQCPPFDLARYGDILINVMLCASLCLFTYRDLWTMFGCLVISSLWLYGYDTYRFLRLSTRSTFVSQKLSKVAEWLGALPCAILCSCLAFRIYAASDGRGDGFMEQVFHSVDRHLVHGTTSMVHQVMNRDTIVTAMVVAALVHLALHFSALHWLVPYLTQEESSEHDKGVPYSKTASKMPCNWFNANPIYCLRSRYYYKYDTPVVNFLPGKEYLLKTNPSLGQHYHAEQPEDEDFSVKGFIDFVGELKDEVRAEVNTLKAEVEQLTTHVHQRSMLMRQNTMSALNSRVASPSPSTV